MATSPDDDARRSTWQLLFGKNKKHTPNNNDHVDEDDTVRNAAIELDRPETESKRHDYKSGSTRGFPKPSASPTINVASQLLRALDKRNDQDTEEDGIARECSDQLLGKQNAFVPHLRIHGAAEDTAPTADVARAAKMQAREIINTRFQVEQRANAIRTGKTQAQQQRQATTRVALASSAKAPSRVAARAQGTAERLAKLRDIQSRREVEVQQQQHDQQQLQRMQKQQETRAMRSKSKPKQAGENTPAPRVATKRPEATLHHHSATTRALSKQASYSLSTKQTLEPQAVVAPPITSSNQDEDTATTSGGRFHQSAQVTKAPTASTGRDYRLLDAKLRQLKAENQQSDVLEEKIQEQMRVVLIKKRVWAIWRDRVDKSHRHETSVTRAYQWRLLQRLWTEWRNYARATTRDRLAEHTRLQLVHEKQQLQEADAFYRRQHLPVWFCHWRSVAKAARETRAFDLEIQRRREMAQRLVEKFARPQEEKQVVQVTDYHEPPQQITTEEPPEPRTRTRHPPPPCSRAPHGDTSAAVPQETSSIKIKPTAWTKTTAEPSHEEQDTSEVMEKTREDFKPKDTTSTSRAPPPPDAFYVTMQERAMERKQKREQLKLKYEQQDHEKREALAKQVADREALLEQQKQDERERVRQKKREQERVAREKATLREISMIKNESALLHDKLRLVFHYGWRPWQQQWLVSKRVQQNAVRWHTLRVAHKTWVTWLAFVEHQRRRRRQVERERVKMAVDHHHHTVCRRVLELWKLAQLATQQKSLALRRQSQWNEMHRVWRRWHHGYASALSRQHQQETRVRHQLNRRKLQNVLAAWRAAARDGKRDRVRQAEKELLWKKARMWLND